MYPSKAGHPYPHNQNPNLLRKEAFVVNKENLGSMIKKYMEKYKLNLKPGNEKDILMTLNNGLEQFLKNTIEGLLKISRTKNINLNMYNKLTEKNPVIFLAF